MNDAIFYQQGLTWDEYFYSMQSNQRLMARHIAFCRLSDADRASWQQATHVAHVLIFTEDYCPDSVHAIPPLMAIHQVAPFDLRVLRRDEDPDRMRAVTGDPSPRVPTFIFYDKNWQEIGRFVERPEALNHLDELSPDVQLMLRQDRTAFLEWIWDQIFSELRPIAQRSHD